MDDLTIHHDIASYECGSDMMLKPEAFMHLCQEIAELHASRNNLGYEWGLENHVIWVETQGDYELTRRPRWKETVTLRTNTGKASALQARRFVEMTDTEGKIIARADLMWVLIDITSRRPVPLKRVRLDLAAECPPTINTVLPTLGEIAAEATCGFTAPRRDVDFNGHINNAAYLIWVLETLPRELQPKEELAQFHIAFKHESHTGDTISIHHSLSDRMTQHIISCAEETRAEVTIKWK